MAGIGFELKKWLKRDSYTGLLGAAGFAASVSSGPWLLAIVSILVLSSFGKQIVLFESVSHFQVIIIYLIASSLILSGLFHHSYSRHTANLLFEKRSFCVVPGFNSVMFSLLILSAILGWLGAVFLLPGEKLLLQLIFVSIFVLSCVIWVATTALAGLLAYRAILIGFALACLVSMVVGYFSKDYGLIGLLFGWLLGQFVLFLSLLFVIYRYYPTKELIDFEFYRNPSVPRALFFTGLLFNIGIWIDKFLFWYHDKTGVAVFHYFHMSFVYDVPIFLAYLCVVPVMAVFLLRIETRFSDAYDKLYQQICGEFKYEDISASYADLVLAGQEVILSVIKAAVLLLVVGVTFGKTALGILGLPTLYFPIFLVCLTAASLNVLLWAILDLIFYLDKTIMALYLILAFVALNAALTLLSIHLGIYFYGYGLAFSLFLSALFGFYCLRFIFSRLLFETYMLDKRA